MGSFGPSRTGVFAQDDLNALTIQNHVLRRRIEDRATTDRFAERFAEVTQTGVADLDCRFGDIIIDRCVRVRPRVPSGCYANIAEW